MDHIAKVSTQIAAPASKVWDALTNPEQISKYMFGTQVDSDFRPGSPITWKGEWKGKTYEDKGKILAVEKEKVLRYTHFSPLTGEADKPENYHTVDVSLAPAGGSTTVTLKQDHNATPEAREHSEKNWGGMLEGLKKLLES